MDARIALLPGDGIGPEVTAAAKEVLRVVGELGGHHFEFLTAPIGGAAIDQGGEPLPPSTLEICESADAALLGAVGGPQWPPEASVRPEQGLLALRQHFGLFANLRPIKVFPAMVHRAPLRPERLEGVDLLIVRELTGGLYFGPRREQGAGSSAHDTLVYSEDEVERIARLAFEIAQGRRGQVTSVDKANVLASMRLWRRTVEKVAGEFSGVRLEHALVDSCAMQLLLEPSAYDVIVAGNLFGDILSDEAAVLAGSLGLLPSASLGKGRFGVYEPVHGSAPDLAGLGLANPIGAILSAAMLLRHSLGLEDEANLVERAVHQALDEGIWTADLDPRSTPASTMEMARAVCHGMTPAVII